MGVRTMTATCIVCSEFIAPEGARLSEPEQMAATYNGPMHARCAAKKSYGRFTLSEPRAGAETFEYWALTAADAVYAYLKEMGERVEPYQLRTFRVRRHSDGAVANVTVHLEARQEWV